MHILGVLHFQCSDINQFVLLLMISMSWTPELINKSFLWIQGHITHIVLHLQALLSFAEICHAAHGSWPALFPVKRPHKR